MDIKGLQYFMTAAERLNFTLAAKECYITQTAMSLHIKKMEDELGFKLFNRNKHTTELTRAGEDFYIRAKALVFEYEMAVKHARNVDKGMGGMLGILVPGCIEGFMLMDKLRAFRAQHPDVNINMYVDTLGRHVGRLKMGNADVSIGPPEELELDHDFIVKKLREDPMVAVVSVNHPLAKMEYVTAEMIKNETAILCGYEDVTTSFRVVRGTSMLPGFEPKSIMLTSNVNELFLMVELERGISFMPAFAKQRIRLPDAGIAFIPCVYENASDGAPEPTTETMITYLKNNTNPVLEPFLEILLSK